MENGWASNPVQACSNHVARSTNNKEEEMISKLEQEFNTYHSDNPEVFASYVKFAKQAKDAGKKVLSISLLTERIRWELMLATKSRDGFKINNNHQAFYSRKLNNMSEFSGMFRTRTQRQEAVTV
jgi:hypothetical protein